MSVASKTEESSVSAASSSDETTTLITLNWARVHLDKTSYQKSVYPLRDGLIKIIHGFSDWLSYPNGKHCFGLNPRRINGIAISNDGLNCYAGSKDGTLIHWDLINSTMIHEWKAHSYGLSSVAYHSGLVATGGTDYRIYVWNAQTHKLVRSMKTEKVSTVTFFKNGESVLGGNDMGSIDEFSVATGRRVGGYNYHRDIVSALIWDVPTNHLISSSRDLSIRLWFRGGCNTKRDNQKNTLCDISLNCDRSLLASGGDKGINIRSYPKLELIQSIDECLTYLCFHPKRPNILAGGSSYKLLLLDVSTGEVIHVFEEGSYVSSRPMRFTPDGTRLVVGNGSVLYMFDLKDLI